MAEKVTVILAFILAVPLWILYHKVFTVVYRGDLLYAILGELFGALFTGFLLAQLLVHLFGAVIIFLLKVLIFLFKVVFIISLISVALWMISFIVFLFKNHLRLFTSADIPLLSEKKARDACSGPIIYSFWHCAYMIHHHRISTFSIFIIAIILVLLKLGSG